MTGPKINSHASWAPTGMVLRPAKSTLSALGYDVAYEQTTLEQLRAYLEQGMPCIIFLRTGALPYWTQDVAHAVVLVRLQGQTVYLHDPELATGPTSLDQSAFLLAWSDLDHYCATMHHRS